MLFNANHRFCFKYIRLAMKNYGKLSIVLIMLSSLMLISCASGKKNGDNEGEQKLSASDSPPMRVISKIIVKSPEMNTTAMCEMQITSDNKIKISVTGPFGIKVADVWADSERVLVLDNIGGRAYTGKPSKENMNETINFSESIPGLILKIRESVFSTIREPVENEKITADFPEFSIKSNDGKNVLTIDPKEVYFEEITLNLFPDIPENMELINLDTIE